ncbi:DNA-directed RNA polymerases II and IV subunit 5A, partial [Mucuna pruriens]
MNRYKKTRGDTDDVSHKGDKGYLVGNLKINIKCKFKSKYAKYMNYENVINNNSTKDNFSDQIHIFFSKEVKVGFNTKCMNFENIFRAILVFKAISSKFRLNIF